MIQHRSLSSVGRSIHYSNLANRPSAGDYTKNPPFYHLGDDGSGVSAGQNGKGYKLG